MQWLKDVLELLSPGWVGSLIGLAGIGAAGITYILTRQRTRFAYCYAGERLLGLSTDGLPSNITVQYRGQEIDRLTRTLIVFWNAGEKTILAEDIVVSDPLRLRFHDNGRILAATVLKEVRDVCQVKAQFDALNPIEVAVSFSFLDSGDGAIIEVLHTNEKRHAELLGTLRGLPNGPNDLGRIAVWNYTRRRLPVSPRLFGWVVTIMGLISACVGPLVPWESLGKTSTDNFHKALILIVVGAFYMLIGFALLFLTRRRYPRTLNIEEL